MKNTSDLFMHYLLLALKQAKSRRGFCAPNPSVGAVVVKDEKCIALGRHWAAGSPHAEVDALDTLGEDAVGATLFVTLEPCCHHGKTPPCTERIIQSGIKQLVFSLMDPNPLVAGKGMQALREAGIDCQQVDVPEITDFYRSYRYWMQEGRPWVTMKLAISADDKIAGSGGEPFKITGEACREFTHTWRQRSDAILTTVQTIINDDPQMNLRVSEEIIAKPLYLLDSNLRLPLDAQIFKTAKNITVYHRKNCDVSRLENLQKKGVCCVAVACKELLDLEQVLEDIGQQGVHDLWVEVGARCFWSFYQANLAQRIFIYRSKKIVGAEGVSAFLGGEKPFSDKALVWRPLGEDAVCELI